MSCIYKTQNKTYNSVGALMETFEPNQIKSATENTGQFSTNNNDIRYQKATNEDIVAETQVKILEAEDKQDLVGYHGTNNEFTDFKNQNPNIDGFWFSSSKKNANTYGKNIKKVFLNIKNPLIIDVKGEKFTEDVEIDVIASYPNEKPYTTKIKIDLDEVVYMVKNGKRKNSFIEIPNSNTYDGVIFKNIIDPSLSSKSEEVSDSIVVFSNSQIRYGINGNTFYKNLKVTENGLELVSNDTITITEVKEQIENYPEIKNYFNSKLISPIIFPNELEEEYVSEQQQRDYISNYPQTLPIFAGMQEQLESGYIKADSQEQYLRTNKGLYENVGNSIFAPMRVNKTDFKVFNLNEAPQPYTGRIIKVKNEESVAEVSNKFSKEEEKNIDKNHFDCI